MIRIVLEVNDPPTDLSLAEHVEHSLRGLDRSVAHTVSVTYDADEHDPATWN